MHRETQGSVETAAHSRSNLGRSLFMRIGSRRASSLLAFLVLGGCGSGGADTGVLVPDVGGAPDAGGIVITTPDAGGGACVPATCAELGANCGAVTDHKCGGVVDCGTCGNGNFCGGAGPNQCG